MISSKQAILDFTAAFLNLSLVHINVLSSLFIQGEHFSDTRIWLNGACFSIVKRIDL